MSQPRTVRADRIRAIRNYEAAHETPPWAAALARYIKCRARVRKEAICKLEPYHMEALAAFQGYSCLVTGTKFVLPEDREMVKYSGYMKWFKSLDSIDRQYAPLPIRAEKSDPWTPGNIILVSGNWISLYEQTSGSVEFHQAILSVLQRIKENTFVIMGPEEYPGSSNKLVDSSNE